MDKQKWPLHAVILLVTVDMVTFFGLIWLMIAAGTK